MGKIKDFKLQDMIENQDNYIAIMSTCPDKKLSKHLDLVNAHIGLAWNQKNETALERLDTMWRQIVAARLTKC